MSLLPFSIVSMWLMATVLVLLVKVIVKLLGESDCELKLWLLQDKSSCANAFRSANASSLSSFDQIQTMLTVLDTGS